MSGYDTGYSDYLDLEELNDEYQGIEGIRYSDPPRSKKKLTEKLIQQIRQQQFDDFERKASLKLGFTPYNGLEDVVFGYDPSKESLKDTPVRSSMADTDIPFGSSRYDKHVETEEDLYNLEDVRARNQSSASLITNGLGKMAVIAITTAADDLIGPIEGVFNIGKQAIRGNIHGFGDVVDAYVQNPASKWILGLNDQAENAMPNYYTNEERDAHWYEIWYHANFIGDHFLKNAGYMLGAYLGSKAMSFPLSKVFKVNEARNIYKNTALAMGMEDKTYNEVIKAYNSGKKIGSEAMVAESLVLAAKNAKHAELYLKLASTAFGSIGESRMEAITNSDDWFNKNKQNLDLINLSDVENIPEQIEQEHPELFGPVPIIDTRGQLVGYLKGIVDEEGYQREYSRKEAELKQKYESDLAELTKQRVDYSNASFGINFLLTYGENLNIFGDAIAGSWSKRSKFNRRIKRTLDSLKQRGLAKPLDIGIGIVRGPVFEGTQEMFQQATVTHLNRRAANAFNQYYGDILDKDGLDYQTGFMKNFMYSIKDTYADADEWENFALGAVTALIPLPTRINVRGNTQTDSEGNMKHNDNRSRIVAGGELWDSIRRARQDYKDTEALVKALNDIESDPNQLNKFYNLVKSYRISELQQEALDNNDQKSYKDLEFEKIANMVMLYSDAGLIDYLKELIDLAYTVQTPELILSIRSSMTYTEKQGDKDVTRSLFDDMEDDEIVEYFEDQKSKVFDKVDRLSKIYNDLNELYGDFGEDQQQVYNKTLALDIMTIDDRERRIKDLSSKVLDWFSKYSEQFTSGLDENNLTEELKQQLNEISEALETLNDISNLNIVLGNEGFLLRLDNIRNDQRLSLTEKYNEILKEINEVDKLLEEKYESPEENKKLAYRHYLKVHGLLSKRRNKAAKALGVVYDKIKSIDQSIESTTKGLNYSKDINDLLSLLKDREMLYNQLAVLSGQGGIELFFEGLSMDVAVMLDGYKETYSQKFYDKFSQSHNVDDIPEGLVDVFRDIARKKKDDTTNKYLDLLEKYIYGENSLYDKFTEDKISQREYIAQQISTIIQQSESPEQAQELIYEAFRNQDDLELKSFLEKFESDIKDLKQRQQDTESGTSEMNPPQSTQDEDSYGLLASFEEEDIKNISGNKSLLKSYLTNIDENKNLLYLFAQKIDYDGEGSVNDFVESYIDQASKEDLYNILMELYNEAKSSTKKSGTPEQPSENEPEEENPEEGSETPEPEPEPEPDNGDEIFTMGDANDLFDDEVSDVLGVDLASLGENNSDEFKQEYEDTDDSPKGFAEAIIDDQYLDENGNDVENDDNATKPDVLNVHRYSARYSFDVLSYRGRRMLLVYKTTGTTSYRLFSDWLNEDCKVLEFIDNGFLNKVIEHNGGNLNTVVRFVGVNDESLLSNLSVNYKQYKLNEVMFAAIEIPQELRNEYDKAGFKLIDFKDKDGNTVLMQILGVITPQKDLNGDIIRGKFYTDPDFKKLADDVYKNREEIKDKNGDSVRFMAYDFYSNIEFVYSGRIVKETEDIPYQERVLSDLLTAEQIKDPDGQFLICLYIDNERSVKIGMLLDGDIVDLNTKSFKSINARKSGRSRTGSVWILTKEADGKIYHKGARLIDFDASYYQAHKDDRNNPYLNGIRRAIGMIVNAKSNEQKGNALHELLKYLYFPEHDNMFIRTSKDGSKRILFINNYGSDATPINLDDKDAGSRIMSEIIKKGYKFSIGATSLKDIVDSDIITTDLAVLHNRNASFTISRVIDGKPVKAQKTHDEAGYNTEDTGDSQNGNTYFIQGLKPGDKGEFKVFEKSGIIINTKTKKEVTNDMGILILRKCYEIDTGRIDYDEKLKAFSNISGRGSKKSVFVVKYDSGDGIRYQAFIYDRAGENRKKIQLLDAEQSNVIGKIKFEDYTPSETDVISSIMKMLGLKQDNSLQNAVKKGKGVVEKPLPVVRELKKQTDVLFKIGDRIRIQYYSSNGDEGSVLEATVKKINPNGSIDVLIDGKQNLTNIPKSSVLNFFGKSNAFGDYKILSRTQQSDDGLQPISQTNQQPLQKGQLEHTDDKSRAKSAINRGRKSVQYQFNNDQVRIVFEQIELRLKTKLYSLLGLKGMTKLLFQQYLDNLYTQYNNNTPLVIQDVMDYINQYYSLYDLALKDKKPYDDTSILDRILNTLDSIIQCP